MKDTSTSVVYGMHAIIEVLRAKRRQIHRLYISDRKPKHVDMLLRLVNTKKTIIAYVDNARLKAMCESDDHQGVVALVDSFGYQRQFFDSKKYPLVVILDRIHDPRNLGAILRSAYCFNVSGIVLTEQASCSITGTVVKSSAGLSEYCYIYKTKTIQVAVHEAKTQGYTIYATSMVGDALSLVKPEGPSCIIIGNEHEGVSKNILDSNKTISIAQKETESSLNASVAAGIVLYDFAFKMKLIG